MTTIDYIIVIAFSLTMIANAITLIRHWRTLRAFSIALDNLIETQGMFVHLMEEQAMPKKYEAIRDKFKAEGLSTKIAKQRAAKIFNATRKPGTKPVTGKHGASAAHKGK